MEQTNDGWIELNLNLKSKRCVKCSIFNKGENMLQGMIGSLSGIKVQESFLPEAEDVILIHKGQITLFKNAFDTYKEWENFQHKKLVAKIFGIEIWKNRTLHTTSHIRKRCTKVKL